MRRQTLHRLLWGVLVLVIVGIVGASFWNGLGTGSKPERREKRPLEGLDVFGSVPDFTLIERSGKRFGLSDLKGKTWIANFIYTSCTDTCPLQSAALAKLQGELSKSKDWRLVSISVDPEHDAPAVLSGYAERFGADPERWFFLTGDKGEIYRLAQEGFRLSAAPAPGANNEKGRIVLHSARFVLVDGHGQIRGYYDSQDDKALKRLERDIKQLIEATA